MNEHFTLEMTPAKARILAMMAEFNNLELDESVLAIAEVDRVSSSSMAELGIADPEQQAAIQFVIDTDFRCGIPTRLGEQLRAKHIIDTALALGGIPKDETIHLMDLSDYSFMGLVPHRRKVLLVDTGPHNELPDMIGRLFPRIVMYGGMTIQFSFLDKQAQTTSDMMGALLHPGVWKSLKNTSYKNTEPRTLIAMGIFPGMAPLGPLWSQSAKKVLQVEQE